MELTASGDVDVTVDVGRNDVLSGLQVKERRPGKLPCNCEVEAAMDQEAVDGLHAENEERFGAFSS